MRAHHRMLGARVRRLVGHAHVRIEPAIGRLAVVQGRQAVKIGLHAVGERLVGRIHRGEQRVAAARRALLDVEDRAHRRLLVAGDVGVPALAVGARGILVGIDLHQRRIVALMRRRRMHMQVAELAPEGEMLRRGDVLVAEEDDGIFRERAVDLVHLAVRALLGHEPAEIDAGNLRADDGRELLHRNGLVGLFLAGCVAIARPLLAGERGHGVSSGERC